MNLLFNPSKVVAVGLNYRDHAQELSLLVPKEPLIFLKPSSAIIGNNESIILPAASSHVEFEAELAIIIGKNAKDVSVEQAGDYIIGYTCANDITARDLQKIDGQWVRAKGFDTFMPLGPNIVSDVDPTNLNIQLFQNGVEKQSSNTSEMVFNVFEIVSYVSHVMSLNTGDVIITGTPYGVGQIQSGDELEVRIEKIGSLFNKVV